MSVRWAGPTEDGVHHGRHRDCAAFVFGSDAGLTVEIPHIGVTESGFSDLAHARLFAVNAIAHYRT